MLNLFHIIMNIVYIYIIFFYKALELINIFYVSFCVVDIALVWKF